MKKHKIAPEVKEQILHRIKNEGVSVCEAAREHGVAENTVYHWISRKLENQPTVSEIIRLKKENRQLLELVGEMTLKLSEAQKKNS